MILKPSLFTSLFKKSTLTLAFVSCFLFSHSSAKPSPNDTKDVRKTSSYLGFTPKEDSASVAYPNRFAKGYNVQLPALIQGQLPGLNVYSNGEPGKPFEVHNRLFTSFSLPNVSFYVVDNMPIYGNVGFLNLDDIASISFVDGGTAASIYGERAASGAIVIKTKAATSSLKVTYSGSAAVSSVAKQVDVYTADELKEIIRRYDPAQLTYLGTANTNWQDVIYRNSFSHQHSVAISDSRYGLPFRASVGYTDQQGVIKTTEYSRLTGAITVSPSFFNEDLRVDAGVWFANEKSSPDIGASSNAIFSNPSFPVYEDNSYGGYFYEKNADGTPAYYDFSNPLALLNQIDRSKKIWHVNESIKATYRLPFFRGLSVSAGLTRVSSKQDYTEAEDEKMARNYQSEASSIYQNNNGAYTTWDLAACYNREFDWLNSRVQATVGYTENRFETSSNSKIWRGGGLIEYSRSDDEANEKAAFARIRYSIFDKYTVGFSLHDGKSSYGWSDKNEGAYSVSGNWNVKKELFLENTKAISSLNVFASFGKTRGGEYITTESGSLSQLPVLSIYNFRVGAELVLYDRVSVTIAYSRNKVKKDFPVMLPYPNTSGYGPAYYYNLFVKEGGFKSSNMELAAQALLLSKNDFRWDTGISFSYAANEVEEIPNESNMLISGNRVDKEGSPIGSFYLYKQIYDANGKPIEGKYEDLNSNGTTHDDYHVCQQPTPQALVSISSQLRYKSWDLSLLGRASFGNYVYNGVAARSTFGYLVYRQYNASRLAERANFFYEQPYSDFYVENGSFFRMEYISLGYTFGGKLRPHLSATVQNAFIISGYSGIDPEVSSGNDYPGIYPRPRVFSIGLELAL